MTKFGVIVVGGGHAGCEAAAAAARMGVPTALINQSRTTLGAMSCNPAIGGLGKGHLVREIDALDGILARAADASAIHYRMLNASKGAAVRGPRIQADRALFKRAVQHALADQPNLTIIQGSVVQLRQQGSQVDGVVLADGSVVAGAKIVLATGTFLNGKLFCGEERASGGRIDEPAALGLGDQLRALGLPLGRLKTGTPPRLDGRTIDWAALDQQASDDEGWTFSDVTPHRLNPQLFCGVTRTNVQTHDIIRDGLDRSPLFGGDISGRGPRYCPSIEDKIHRFGDRDGHQIFLEPEGLDDPSIYPNGISTSLPRDVQAAMLRSIKGLERVEVRQWGYAVEYDHIDPRALNATLAIRALPDVYCAGQINGTTGYEEAAAQGLVAGLNAAAAVRGGGAVPLDRASSYIGVMIDDLVLQGITEPYRMLTARAEYRLRLRADNASTRLTEMGIAFGCVRAERAAVFEARARNRADGQAYLATSVPAQQLGRLGPAASRSDWVRLAQLDYAALVDACPALQHLPRAVVDELIEDARYAPYVARQDAEIRDLRRGDQLRIEPDLDYATIPGLSHEMVERLSAAQPATLGEAERIPGITPAALAAILTVARRRAA